MSENKKSELDESCDVETEEIPEQTAKEIHVSYDESPTPQWNRKIHPRQIIPPVPEGEKKVPDDTPSPPVELD